MAASENPDPIDVEVGARIRVRRKSLALSQSALAASLNLTFQQVQKYERGANRVSASMLVRIAATLKTTVAALVGENDEDRQSYDVYAKLATQGALELIEAYVCLPDAETRRGFVTLIKTIAPAAPKGWREGISRA